MNYVDDYECSAGCYVPDATGMPVRATSPVRISDWKTFDFNIGYDLSGLGGFFNAARVNFTAVNFTDADPPFFDSGTTAVVDTMPDPYEPANATALGRTLVLSFDMVRQPGGGGSGQGDYCCHGRSIAGRGGEGSFGRDCTGAPPDT